MKRLCGQEEDIVQGLGEVGYDASLVLLVPTKVAELAQHVRLVVLARGGRQARAGILSPLVPHLQTRFLCFRRWLKRQRWMHTLTDDAPPREAERST